MKVIWVCYGKYILLNCEFTNGGIRGITKKSVFIVLIFSISVINWAQLHKVYRRTSLYESCSRISLSFCPHSNFNEWNESFNCSYSHHCFHSVVGKLINTSLWIPFSCLLRLCFLHGNSFKFLNNITILILDLKYCGTAMLLEGSFVSWTTYMAVSPELQSVRRLLTVNPNF